MSQAALLSPGLLWRERRKRTTPRAGRGSIALRATVLQSCHWDPLHMSPVRTLGQRCLGSHKPHIQDEGLECRFMEQKIWTYFLQFHG